MTASRPGSLFPAGFIAPRHSLACRWRNLFAVLLPMTAAISKVERVLRCIWSRVLKEAFCFSSRASFYIYLTRIAALMRLSVSDWPRFSPIEKSLSSSAASSSWVNASGSLLLYFGEVKMKVALLIADGEKLAFDIQSGRFYVFFGDLYWYFYLSSAAVVGNTVTSGISSYNSSRVGAWARYLLEPSTL